MTFAPSNSSWFLLFRGKVMAKVSVGSPNTCVTPLSTRIHHFLTAFPFIDLSD